MRKVPRPSDINNMSGFREFMQILFSFSFRQLDLLYLKLQHMEKTKFITANDFFPINYAMLYNVSALLDTILLLYIPFEALRALFVRPATGDAVTTDHVLRRQAHTPCKYTCKQNYRPFYEFIRALAIRRDSRVMTLLYSVT